MPHQDQVRILRIGEWKVDPDLDELSRDGQTIRLEPRPMRLLLYLAAHAGRVIDVQQLLDAVWPNVVVTQGSVYQAVAQLRNVLGDDSEHPRYIENLPRRGYRLIADVTPWDSSGTAASDTAPGAGRVTQMPAGSVPADPVHASGALEPAVTATAGVAGPRLPESAAWSRQGALTGGIALAVVIIAAIAFGSLWNVSRGPATAVHTGGKTTGTASAVTASIAVLPFLDLSEKHDQEYFADGMAEELLDLLVKVPQLRVIGRTSSFQFRDKTEDLQSIADKLGVGFVVEGSVRRSGDAIRVTSQLIRTQDGTHVWSETYDRNVVDALQVQSQIAYGIARALQLTIVDTDALARGPIHNVDAYNIYLKGRHAVDRYDQTGFEEGAADFEQALRLDPTFAPAVLWLAWTLTGQAMFGYVPPAAIEKGRAAAQRAARLDPSLAMAHAILGAIHLVYDWDWAATDREVALALALEPNNVWSIGEAGDVAIVFGRWDEAMRYTNETIALSPLEPSNWNSLADLLVRAGRLDQAETAYRRVLEMSPTFTGARSGLGWLYLLRGQPEAARVQFERVDDLLGLAAIYHALARHAESDQMLARASAKLRESKAFAIAEVHAFRGEPDAAFDWLARAYRQKDLDLVFIRSDPFLKFLEHDPRYDAFLRKMNLATSQWNTVGHGVRGERDSPE